MKYYQVDAAFIQVSGRLHLTDAQAEARAYALKPVGDNRFLAAGKVSFKKGEVFGCEADLPRGQAVELELDEAGFERRVKSDRAAVAAAREKARKERVAREAAAKRKSADHEARKKAQQEQAARQAAERHARQQGA